jgi:hypothetical protein
MGNGDDKNKPSDPAKSVPAKSDLPPEPPAKTAYDLPESIFSGAFHFGVAITITAGGKQSTIMIPDATRISKGEPVYTTGRVDIRGEGLKKFLEAKGVKLPGALARILGDATMACDAFYYSTNPHQFDADETQGTTKDDRVKTVMKSLGYEEGSAEFKEWLKNRKKGDKYEVDLGPLLMMFSITFDNGVISDLVGDKNIGDLFDIKGGSIRVVRCPHDKIDTLKNYVKQLQQIS